MTRYYIYVHTGGAPVTVKTTQKEYKRLIEAYKIEDKKQVDVIGLTKFTTYALAMGDAHLTITKAETTK